MEGPGQPERAMDVTTTLRRRAALERARENQPASDRGASGPALPCLTTKDYSLLQGHLIRLRSDGVDGLAARVLRAKLEHAVVLPPDLVEPDVATAGSRLEYVVDGRAEESRLEHWYRHHTVGATVVVTSILGAVLLGMRGGQSAPLPRADGSVGRVVLRKVAYQPEAARRRPPQPPA
jgi:regulator of nucleoside diphosphate kinase